MLSMPTPPSTVPAQACPQSAHSHRVIRSSINVTHGSLGPPKFPTQAALNQFSRYCRAHGLCSIDRQAHTDHGMSVSISHILCHAWQCGQKLILGDREMHLPENKPSHYVSLALSMVSNNDQRRNIKFCAELELLDRYELKCIEQ